MSRQAEPSEESAGAASGRPSASGATARRALRGAAHLWLVAIPEAADRDLDGLRRLLSRAEMSRYRRFKVARARREFLVGRALVRTTLSRYADVEPAAWRFRIGDHGRPEIDRADADDDAAPMTESRSARAPRLRFNRSHSRGLAACVVTDGVDCGVDVEEVGRVRSPLDLAEHYFAPAEAASLAAVSGPARQELFAALWTLKEAYIKARGRGVSLGLRRFAFTLAAGGGIGVRFDRELDDEEVRWQFALSHPTRRHALALALGRGGGRDLTITARTLTAQDLARAARGGAEPDREP